MTLGNWFRDYVYIPMGGNRVKQARWIFNIAAVWMLTGFWHGADWNFIVWGLMMAVLLVAEKFLLPNGRRSRVPSDELSHAPNGENFHVPSNEHSHALNDEPLDALSRGHSHKQSASAKKSSRSHAIRRIFSVGGRVASHTYTMLAVVISFVIFNGEGMSGAWADVSGMFGAGGIPLAGELSLYYLRSFAPIFVIAAFLSTPVLKNFGDKLLKNNSKLTLLEPVLIAASLILVTANLVDGSFNPFIYFRF